MSLQLSDELAEIIAKTISTAQHVLVVQADNPDSDSLGSALALEAVLQELGKQTSLYCAVDVPAYLRFFSGWDRVTAELPKQFDASIIVDASTMTLLERLKTSGGLQQLAKKPCVVLDHHAVVEQQIPFASALINQPDMSSTGELIYHLAKQLKWPLPIDAQSSILQAILGDTQGLSNQLAVPLTYRVVADVIEAGVDRAALEEKRRDYNKMPIDILRYKAKLIERIEFFADNQIAVVIIPPNEIYTYSPLYNPAPLIQTDILQTQGVAIAIVIKYYEDGRVTGAIRSNYGYPIASDLAASLGGGGHTYASGFKVTDGRTVEEIKNNCVQTATEILHNHTTSS